MSAAPLNWTAFLLAAGGSCRLTSDSRDEVLWVPYWACSSPLDFVAGSLALSPL